LKASVTVEEPEAEQGAAGEPVRAPPRLQPVLAATVVAAIILAIAIGEFWTSF
jgi:hypothetical protein